MSRDDLPSSADSSPEEAEPTLPLVESSFQSNLAESYGEESDPTVDLEPGASPDPASARVENPRVLWSVLGFTQQALGGVYIALLFWPAMRIIGVLDGLRNVVQRDLASPQIEGAATPGR